MSSRTVACICTIESTNPGRVLMTKMPGLSYTVAQIKYMAQELTPLIGKFLEINQPIGF